MTSTWHIFTSPFGPLKRSNPPNMWQPFVFLCQHRISQSVPFHLSYFPVTLPHHFNHTTQSVDTSLIASTSYYHINIRYGPVTCWCHHHTTTSVSILPCGTFLLVHMNPWKCQKCMARGNLLCHIIMLTSTMYGLHHISMFAKKNDGYNFWIWSPFEVSFTPLESSRRGLWLGMFFIEFWELLFLAFFPFDWGGSTWIKPPNT